MLQLKEILKAKSVIRFDKEFADAVGILPQNLYQIENPEKAKRVQHFTPEHIEKAGTVFSVDMNFIFGFTDHPFTKGQKIINQSSIKRSTLTTKT